MKVDARRVADVLRSPGAHRAMLIFGPDEELVRERFLAATRSLLGGDTDDPFRLIDLSPRDLKADDPHALAHELAMLPMTGGQRIVRVREAPDRIAPLVKAALSPPRAGFLLLAGGELGAGTGLRKLLEAAPEAAVIACYPPDAAAIASMAEKRFREEAITADRDALELLGERLEGETGLARQAIEMMALYAGPKGRVEVETVLALLGDQGAVALDEGILHAFAGEAEDAEARLTRALADGAGAIALLRSGLRWLQRLQAMRGAMDQGASAGEAVKGARPPVFWKLTGQAERALRRLDGPRIERWSLRLLQAERACKRTGAKDTLLAFDALLPVSARHRGG